MYDDHVAQNGGTLKKEDIESNKKEISKKDKGEKLMKVKKNTLEETKKLLAKQKSLNSIGKTRELSVKTILTHIEKISKKYPDFDMEYLKPNKEILKKVKKAVKEIETKKHKDDFLESGGIKLRAIFKFLKEKVDYDDIKLALVFLDR